MRALVIVPAFALLFFVEAQPVAAQAKHLAAASAPTSQSVDARFAVFPTENMWTVLLLDTSNGRIWQMQYSISDSAAAGRLVVNSRPLVAPADARAGRFTLCATHNMFNFILLDQEDGRAWQVQWSPEAKNRGIANDLTVELQ